MNSFIAVMVGVLIGTVPIGGRTIADRVVSAYQSAPAKKPAPSAKPAQAGKVAVERTAKRTARDQAKAAPERRAPISAGAANSPERHDENDRQALERMIAARSGR